VPGSNGYCSGYQTTETGFDKHTTSCTSQSVITTNEESHHKICILPVL